MKISSTVFTQNYHQQISKGNNFKNVLKRVMVLVLCMSSDGALCFYEVSRKYLEGFSSYRADTKRPLSNFKGEITTKLYGQDLQFLCSASHLMMIYISMKFHENILKSFQYIEQTWTDHYQIIAKLYRQELWFLCSALPLMMLYISMKFHDNILNGFQIIEGTQNYHSLIARGNNSKNV